MLRNTFTIISDLESYKLVVIWHKLICIRPILVYIYILRFISMLRFVYKLKYIYKLLLFISRSKLIFIYILRFTYWLIYIC